MEPTPLQDGARSQRRRAMAAPERAPPVTRFPAMHREAGPAGNDTCLEYAGTRRERVAACAPGHGYNPVTEP